MRILVIEDDPTVGQYVRRGLEEQRWSVDLVADGEEGERRAGSEAYDLIILDMRLPGKPGLDVLNSLRARGSQRVEHVQSRFSRKSHVEDDEVVRLGPGAPLAFLSIGHEVDGPALL